jgi:hypothetical protein
MGTTNSAGLNEWVFPSDVLDGPRSRRAFLRNLVASTLAFGSNGLAANMGPGELDPWPARIGREYDAPVRVAERDGQTTNELCGGAFADVIISSFFGFQPDWAGNLPIVNPEMPRGFEGRLSGLRWRGKLYTVTSGAHGVSMKMQ